MSLFVDLNADLGEGVGHDAEILPFLTSPASPVASMLVMATPRAAVAAAKSHGVAVGAHPSLFDRENFGRKELPVRPEQVSEAVVYQLGVFQAIAEAAGVRPNHVKPHGALYNMAARDEPLAEAVVAAIAQADSCLFLFAPGNSKLAEAGRKRGLRVVAEVFADRNYLADGSLVPRTRPDALLHDPEEAAVRVVRMLGQGKVLSVEGTDVCVQAETICVHGDTPEAVQIAKALRSALEKEGVTIRAPGSGD